jgi:phosphoglycolate phosphatase-like HAD superfamily hydrolase
VAVQYEQVALAVGVSPQRVRRIVTSWFNERPIPHLLACRFAGISELFNSLRHRGIITGVLSDYRAAKKLAALGIQPDIQVSSEDPDIDWLKPNPKGLLHLLNLAAVKAQNALFIGDREETDGECARRANVPFILKVSNGGKAGHHLTRYSDFASSIKHVGFYNI